MSPNGNKQHFFERAMVGFIIAVAIAIIGGINTIRYVYIMQNDLRSWYENDLLGQNSIQVARINLMNIDRDLKALLLSRDPAKMKATTKNISRHRSNFIKQIEIARALFTSPKDMRYIKTSLSLSNEYLGMLDRIMASNNAARTAEIARTNADMSAKFEKIDAVMDKLDDIKQEKDLRIFRTIISQNEITMGISVLILVITIIIRAIQLSASRKKKPA
jgi:hypothetical protein